MKKIILRLVLLLLFITIPYGVTCLWYARSFKTTSLHEELVASGGQGDIDTLVIGTSHAIAMRRLNLGDNLNILNAGSAGMGIYPSLTKIDYISTHCDIKKVLFVCDAFQFVSQRNEFAYTFDTVKWDFELWECMQKYDFSEVAYLRYIFGVVGNLPSIAYASLFSRKDISADEEMVRRVVHEDKFFSEHPDPSGFAAGRIRGLFFGVNENDARKYLSCFCDSLSALQERGIKVYVVIPPLPSVSYEALPPFHDMVVKELETYCEVHGIPFVDFTRSIPDPSFFSDADHLNSKGLKHFVELLSTETDIL